MRLTVVCAAQVRPCFPGLARHVPTLRRRNGNVARRAWCAVRFLPIRAEAFAAAAGLLGYELPGYVAHGHGHGRGGAEHEHGARRGTRERRQSKEGSFELAVWVLERTGPRNYYYEGK